MQTPSTHASPLVLALPSSQVVPFVAAGFEQVPVPGLQVRRGTGRWRCRSRVAADAHARLTAIGLRASVAVRAGGAVGFLIAMQAPSRCRCRLSHAVSSCFARGAGWRSTAAG